MAKVNIPTPHNAAKKGDIAEIVLLPGDPLRAKFIAETYLSDVKCYNTVRNMLGFTGKYKGKSVSVQGTGMGVPSIAIYSYELIHGYDCKRLIRVGTAGGYQKDLKIGDLIFAMSACTDTNYASQFQFAGTYAPTASWSLLKKAVDIAEEKKVRYKVGTVFTSETFYNVSPFEETHKKWMDMGVLAVEMEAAALYMNAAYAGVDALCITSVSDSFVTGEDTDSSVREKAFTNMMEVALELA